MTDASELARLIRDMPVASTHTHHLADGWHASLDLGRLLGTSYVNWLGFPLAKPNAHPADLIDQIGANTYFVWLSKSLAEIYGLGELAPHNWDAINEAIRLAHGDPEWHVRLLRDRARMRFLVPELAIPGDDNGRPDLFRPAYRINGWCLCHRRGVVDHARFSPWDLPGFDAATLDEYLEAMDAAIVAAKGRGTVALKNSLAYARTVAFDDPDREAAQRAFRAEGDVASSDALAFGDVVFHRACEIAEREGLPVQMHLGLAIIRTSGPMLFERTIARHPGTTFDLFHCGYPWVDEIGGLLHNYANVIADLCWLPIISTAAAERVLNEYLDVARSSDRILWGDDTWSGEEAYGALLAWEHVVSRALTRRVNDGLCTMRQAERLAEKLMYANGERVYG